MFLKIIIVISLLWTGFVCGGSYATKKYAERVDVMQKHVDLTSDITKKLFDDLLVCRAVLDLGRKI